MPFSLDNETWVIVAAVAAVALLLVLIIKFKWQEFIALLVTSIVFGLLVGTDPNSLMEFIVEEMGGSLGQLALVIGLGSVFGMMLQRAGAAERIALTLVERFSDRTISWGLGGAGFLVATSVYIDVAIVILLPMLYGVARKTGKSLLHYGIPLCAGLSTAYTFMPPAPGPLATAGIMEADLGLVILFGIICGLPAVFVAGPVFGRFIAKRIYVPAPAIGLADNASGAGGSSTRTADAGNGDLPDSVITGDATAARTSVAVEEHTHIEAPSTPLPSFGSVVGVLVMPLALILIGTIGRLLGEEDPVRGALTFIGHPVIALLLTCLYTLYAFGTRRGLTRDEIQRVATSALGPAGMIILVTGAGGVFGGVLVESGLGDTLADAMESASIPLAVFGFVTAAVMRISQGSGLVAMVTGATFSAPLAEALQASPATVALTCIAIACGGAGFSHVNDSGFWMANRYFGMSVADTLKSWTVMKTLVALTGFSVVLILSAFIS